ncbi:MAG: hypothetical protein JXN59_08250 [Anaerolineae bacterium]|nr:hypothetical protein [Anaerolineae bacterium]
MAAASNSVISTILKHDNKQTSYKIALLRAINDVVLSFPDMRSRGLPVAIPLWLLAEFWLAYYWPFVDPTAPIYQGARAERNDRLRSDMAFRPALTAFREQWQEHWGNLSSPSDGFFIINELRVPRIRAQQPPPLLKSYYQALKKIAVTLQMPIRYAGTGEWTVFARPCHLSELHEVTAVPGTKPDDLCLVVSYDLWETFRGLSLWVEALSIHEWCLFSERVEQGEGRHIDRGMVYSLLTARPDNRRPLTWERNQVDLLIMEGRQFTCPWTEKRILIPGDYDLDHLVPVSVYPINELWNLVPADSYFNSHRKRDKLPTTERLERAKPHLELAYAHYETSPALAKAIHQDVAVRFSAIGTGDFAVEVTRAVTGFIQAVADARNIARF